MTAGSWFFWRRSVDGNGPVPRAGNFTTAGPALNMSMNVTGTPVAEAPVTRSVDGSTTLELTSKFATDESSKSTPSLPAEHKARLVEAVSNHSGSGKVTAEPTSATFTDTLRDRSGTTPATAIPHATEPASNVQSFDVGSTTGVSATSGNLEDVAATSDASCHCHDAVVTSASTQTAAVQQQAHVTHPSAHGASAPGVSPASDGRRSVREPQTTTTAPADYFTPPEYVVY